ncbi:hypothetical protein WP12_12895 [Sphingomonas sp. SRS2]|nr:hypothetical protein WP12_12895 [Sphingomonas sp. SRS2]
MTSPPLDRSALPAQVIVMTLQGLPHISVDFAICGRRPAIPGTWTSFADALELLADEAQAAVHPIVIAA